MRLFPRLLAVALLPGAALAQSSSSSSSGGSSGSARTESAPAGTMRTGPDRGLDGSGPRAYGPAQSPVQGGPPFTGPTGMPLDLPREER